ncbi:MAG: IS1182 family transposase, partial [Spirochaetota bacterium]|nr:IS1182 family transposase [Spirochaetota bacterium]
MRDSGLNEKECERLKSQIEKIEKKAEKIEKFLAENSPKSKSRLGERQCNITDNESTKIKTSRGMLQGYNGMAISDSKNQIILEAEAFGNGQEQGLLKPMIEGAKENANSIGRGEDYLEGKILISDTGSFSEDNLKYLAGEKIDAYIPDQQF